PATRCLTLGATDAGQAPASITAWPELRERAARLFGGGLRGRSEQDEIVLIQPAQWGPGHFDPINQEFQQPIFDAAGNALLIVVLHTPQTENAIPVLERHAAASSELATIPAGGAVSMSRTVSGNPGVFARQIPNTWGVLGLLRLHHGQLALEPITLLRETLV